MLKLAGPAINTTNLAVVTLAELHTHRKTTGETADDARMQTAVDGTNWDLYNITRQRLFLATGTDWDLVLDGPPLGSPLTLPFTPIKTITSLESGYYDVSGWTTQHLYQANEYVADLEAGTLHWLPTQPFPSGRRSMRIVYESGWDFADLPDDLKWATLVWGSVNYERALAAREDRVSVAFEGGSDSFTFDTLPLAAKRTIMRYKRTDRLL